METGVWCSLVHCTLFLVGEQWLRYRRVFSFARKFWIHKNADRMQPLTVSSMIDRSQGSRIKVSCCHLFYVELTYSRIAHSKDMLILPRTLVVYLTSTTAYETNFHLDESMAKGELKLSTTRRVLSFFCLQAILRDPLLLVVWLVAIDMLEQLIDDKHDACIAALR